MKEGIKMTRVFLVFSVILILIFIVSCTSKKTIKLDYSQEIQESDDLKASSTVVFWEMPSNDKNAEKRLKEILLKIGVNFKDLSTQEWNPKESSIGGVRDYKLSKISTYGKWSSVLLYLDSNLGEKISIELSKTLKTPVLAILEFHQISWGYKLFLDGKIIDQFCNAPELVGTSAKDYKGNIDLLSKTFNVDKKNLEPYIDIRNSEKHEKAFKVDEFFLDDHWVRVDFIKKLGITYPEEGKWLYIIEKGVNDN